MRAALPPCGARLGCTALSRGHRPKYPDVYKMMIMEAFPPLDALDQKEVAVDTVEQMEDHLMKWLRVLDSHLKLAKSEESNVLARIVRF